MNDNLLEIALTPDKRLPNTTGIFTPLIPFDLILDLDYGLIKLIKESYRDDQVFDLEVCDLYYKNIIIKLLERWDSNPLSIIMKTPKDKSLVNYYNNLKEEYYKNFMEEELWNICTRAMYTGIEVAVCNFLAADGIEPVIMCRNEIELEFLESIPELKGIKAFIGDYGTIDPNDYDAIYLKNFQDILKIQHKICSRNLYIADYNFNMEKRKRGEEPILRKDLSILFLDSNNGMVMQVYPIDDSYYEVG